MTYDATKDLHAGVRAGIDSLGVKSRLITPGASDIDPYAKSVVCATSGNVTYLPKENADADTVTLTGVPAGYILPHQVRRVTAATATLYTID